VDCGQVVTERILPISAVVPLGATRSEVTA
jgi:hypothetical protein